MDEDAALASRRAFALSRFLDGIVDADQLRVRVCECVGGECEFVLFAGPSNRNEKTHTIVPLFLSMYSRDLRTVHQ